MTIVAEHRNCRKDLTPAAALNLTAGLSTKKEYKYIMNDEHHVLVEACIDVELRERAESILTQLGMSASAAITYYYQQIVLHKGIPFTLKLPSQPE